MEQPQLEKLRGDRVQTSTHAETSSRRKFLTMWADESHAAIPPNVRWDDVK